MGTQYRLGLALLASIAGSICTPVGAQDAAVELPAIDVTSTRLGTKVTRPPSRERPPRLRRAPAPETAPASDTGEVAVEAPSGIAAGTSITGASTTVISANDIARSPGQTVQDILAREPGIQTHSLFGGINGARTTVDLRGFGATAPSNTLVLVNGRRINDLDIEAVDLSTIPRESIERIEVTRGNSGAVLYGDGAVGGVINIVTKTGVAAPPSARIQGSFGSFRHAEGVAAANGSNGAFAAAGYGNAVYSDGYRVNNQYRQRNGVGDFRYTHERGSLYLLIAGDEQHLGLPAHRRVEPSAGINQLITDRRGATTPFDFAAKQGASATAGFTFMLAPGAELVVDGGFRQKMQQAGFFGTFADPASPAPRRYFEAALTTASVTPRVIIGSALLGFPLKAIGGVDYYDTGYDSPRRLFAEAPPIHQYDLRQRSLGLYWQQTVTLPTGTELSAGGRWQQTSLGARDTFDPNAPGAVPFFCIPGICFPVDTQGIPLDQRQTNRAFHVGVEHRLNEHVTLFGRHAQSFRVPNVDERIGMVTDQTGVPTTFDLKTQKSHDLESGIRLRAGKLDLQWSVYDMLLTNEIHFSPATFTNTNLDPTRRYGSEAIAGVRISNSLRVRAGAAYSRAIFREGAFAGNDVPLVSRWTGSFGLSWDVLPKWLTFDGVVRYVGARRMDNDQINLQPLIPAHTLVDLRVGGSYEQLFWSFAIQNLFDVQYFDYAIASPFPFGFGSRIGTFNAYPQPGRTFMARAGWTF